MIRGAPLTLVLALGLLGCPSSAARPGADEDAGDPALNSAGTNDSGFVDAGFTDAGPLDAGSIELSDGGPGDGGCILVGTSPVAIGKAATAGEYALTLPARSSSHTSWATPGNEALVLEVRSARGLIGHLVLHQGADGFDYGMQLGALAPGDEVTVQVSSTLSAANATKQACVGPAVLTPDSQLGSLGEALLNAPIFKWPVQKRFDDLPVLLGWSAARKKYEAYYTNENGGTVQQCGGGATGIQAEIARWGRASDNEAPFSYGGTEPAWERCKAVSGQSSNRTPYSALTPRLEGKHPVLYYGDGHNRLFESRGGYGQTCGTGSPEMADGNLTGWNSGNPGNDAANDGPYTIVVRPMPVPIDSLGYAQYGGTRERALDRLAPWIYRLTDSELRREGKIDSSRTFPVQDYLFTDVFASDVEGGGDGLCTFTTSGGFKLRVKTSDGVTHDGPQMTQDYFGGTNLQWKRIAIPLGKQYSAAQVGQFVFDAYDNDGIYFLQLGDAFMPRPAGDNGATLEYVFQGAFNANVYVDDGNDGCVNGQNDGGPFGKSYPCTGSLFTFTPR